MSALKSSENKVSLQWLLKRINNLKNEIIKAEQIININAMKAKIEKGKQEMSSLGFWKNRERAIEISKEVEFLEKDVIKWEKLLDEVKQLEELVSISYEENDESIHNSAIDQYNQLENKFNKLEHFLLFDGKYDKNNAIIILHAGTGGTEAQDWTMMLKRMYLRFCEKKHWKTKIIEEIYGQEAGIKTVTIIVKGIWAYGELKSEAGVHRLVRISPFDAEAMRHTSFSLVEVIPELEKIESINIRNEDLRIDTFRASGHGGQNVNKVESAIRITHLPTNIVVSCQNERSQLRNKQTALKILMSKLAQLKEKEKKQELTEARGKVLQAEWGNQIRSYVLQPYQMVKDHRTKYQESDAQSVLDGNISGFIHAYLKWKKTHNIYKAKGAKLL